MQQPVAQQAQALGFVAGLVIATLTAPVGISGSLFLLPVLQPRLPEHGLRTLLTGLAITLGLSYVVQALT